MKHYLGYFIVAPVSLFVADVLHGLNHITQWCMDDEEPCPTCIAEDFDAYL